MVLFAVSTLMIVTCSYTFLTLIYFGYFFSSCLYKKPIVPEADSAPAIISRPVEGEGRKTHLMGPGEWLPYFT
jgi:hypothetical protein